MFKKCSYEGLLDSYMNSIAQKCKSCTLSLLNFGILLRNTEKNINKITYRILIVLSNTINYILA